MQPTIDIVPEEFRKWVGRRPMIEDQRTRAEQMAFTMTNEGLARPGSPFWQVSTNGLLLNEQTADYIYNGDYGKHQTTYKKGTHPILEQYIEEVTSADMTEKQKVIALSQSMYYDLPIKYPKVPIFLYNESDEHTLLKGSGHCSCRARLLCALSQMLGIPARPVMQWAWTDPDNEPEKIRGGHTVAEVFLDGEWGFFDPQHHSYCMTEDGRIRGVWDIQNNPEVWIDMPKHLEDEMEPVGYDPADQGDKSVWEYYWYKNFNPKCPIQISRYDVNTPYNPGWLWATPELREKQQSDFTALRAFLLDMASRNEITDEIYLLGKEDFAKRFGLESKMPSLETAA